MGWIFVDKDSEQSQMRQQMRRNMRGGGSYRDGGNYRDEYERGYRQGYKHGWEDYEMDDEENYRRQRDGRGRFV